ncbi:MAG: FecR domain-containing protein [Alphaproteobacteria bacterium]
MRVANVDVSHISAWRFGQMIFDSAPLSDVVNEINRYNARKLVLAEPALAQIAVNGVFRTSNPDAFAEALTEAFPIDVSSEDQHTIRLRRRSAR